MIFLVNKIITIIVLSCLSFNSAYGEEEEGSAVGPPETEAGGAEKKKDLPEDSPPGAEATEAENAPAEEQTEGAQQVFTIGSSTTYFGLVQNKKSIAGSSAAKGITIGYEAVIPFGSWLSLILQPQTYLMQNSETVSDPLSGEEETITIPTLGFGLWDLLAIGRTFSYASHYFHPYVGLGYSGSVLVSAYKVVDTNVVVREIVSHQDLGVGFYAQYDNRFQLNLLYMKSLSANSKISIDTDDGATSTSSAAKWSGLVIKGQYLYGEASSFHARLQFEKPRDRDEKNGGTSLLSSIAIGFSSIR